MVSVREQILGQKAKTKEVSVPGWDMPIRVQEMTVGRKLRFFDILRENAIAVKAYEDDPKANPFVKPIDEAMLGFIFSVVDENNELALKPEDIDALDDLPYYVIQAVYLQALEIGHLSGQLKEIEAEKKG